MGDIRKIEKELFKNNPDHCGKNNGRQHDGTKGKNKEVRTDSLSQGQAEWVNVDMDMEKVKKEKEKEKRDEFWFKVLVAGLIVIAPFIIIYELAESLWFKVCPRKRTDEYRKMVAERERDEHKYVPGKDDIGFFRNTERSVIGFGTYEGLYPKCNLSLWMPDDKAGGYPHVPWLDTVELYSVKVPYVFHSYWADGLVSDLTEKAWLAGFQRQWRLSDAIVSINYKDSDMYNPFFRNRKFERCVLDTFHPMEEQNPLECYVELLTNRIPPEGLDWMVRTYRYCPLGTFTLERRCFDQLTDRSRRRLEQLLEGYGVYI